MFPSSHAKGKALVVLVAFDDLSKGNGISDTRNLDLDALIRIGIGDYDHVASFDACDSVTLLADRLDLDGSVIALSNRRSGLSCRLRRFLSSVSIRVGLSPSLRN